MEIVVGLLVLWFLFAILGTWVAGQKNRNGVEGFALGFLFGPLGVLIEALLPTPEKPDLRPKKPARHSLSITPDLDDELDDEEVLEALEVEPKKQPDTVEDFLKRLRDE
jgi:hypothetical protein